MMSVLYLFTHSQYTDTDTDKRDTFHQSIQAPIKGTGYARCHWLYGMIITISGQS